MASPAEVAAMRRAIALSAAGLGTTSPNPPVGCVLLDPAGRIVGEGYHERKGEPHAEAQALAAAGPLASDATAVVTLEPCNHQGRTPPCRQALIDAGIRRAVVAVIDPTSRGEGGVAELRRADVEVETDVLAGEARIVLGQWLAGLKTRRPVITWPYLITDHGVEALPADTEEARLLHVNADAVLRADGTVREAVPDSHGKGILSLQDQPPGTGATEAAAALYDGGVRHLLLDGGPDAAGPFLASGLVDRVVAFMPHGGASGRPAAGLPWPLLPPGFVITGAARTEGFVRVEGQDQALSRLMAPCYCPRGPGCPRTGYPLGSIARVKTSASLDNDQESETESGSRLVIAVDGPSGAGKSSASRGAASALGLRYLDTGSMYRALTWWLLDRGADTADPEVVARLAAEPVIEVSTDPLAPWTRVDGNDVSEAIRTREVTVAVSAVAAVPQVRAHLIAMQREIIAGAPGIVAEGRDIGTVVAPDAQVKVFLTADGAARASRRAAEASWATQSDQDRRDRLDAAQSGKAADAVHIDSTGLGLDEVVGIIVGLVPQKSR